MTMTLVPSVSWPNDGVGPGPGFAVAVGRIAEVVVAPVDRAVGERVVGVDAVHRPDVAAVGGAAQAGVAEVDPQPGAVGVHDGRGGLHDTAGVELADLLAGRGVERVHVVVGRADVQDAVVVGARAGAVVLHVGPPDEVTVGGVEREDELGLPAHEDELLAEGRDRGHDRRRVDPVARVGHVLEAELGHVGGRDRRVGGQTGVAHVLHEHRPLVGPGRGRRRRRSRVRRARTGGCGRRRGGDAGCGDGDGRQAGDGGRGDSEAHDGERTNGPTEEPDTRAAPGADHPSAPRPWCRPWAPTHPTCRVAGPGSGCRPCR